jgi:hypothetical protein
MGDAVWTTWVPNGPAHEKVEVKKRVRKTAARK